MGLRALTALEEIVDDLVVVGRQDLAPSWPGHTFCGPREGSGPLGALTDVFEKFAHHFVLTLPCDMPLFTSSNCASLLETISRTDSDLAVATDGLSTPQWLAAAWRTESVRMGAIRAYESGERSVERFVETRRMKLVRIDSESLLNLNQVESV